MIIMIMIYMFRQGKIPYQFNEIIIDNEKTTYLKFAEKIAFS